MFPQTSWHCNFQDHWHTHKCGLDIVQNCGSLNCRAYSVKICPALTHSQCSAHKTAHDCWNELGDACTTLFCTVCLTSFSAYVYKVLAFCTACLGRAVRRCSICNEYFWTILTPKKHAVWGCHGAKLSFAIELDSEKARTPLNTGVFGSFPYLCFLLVHIWCPRDSKSYAHFETHGSLAFWAEPQGF